MTDLILIEASRLNKQNSTFEAVKYLSEQALLHPRFSELFFKYYFKSIAYSLDDPELFEQIGSSLNSLIDVLDKRGVFDAQYVNACKLSYNYYLRKRDGDKAMQASSRILKSVNPDNHNYLFQIKQSYERTLAIIRIDVDGYRKDVEFIFNSLMTTFLNLAWHINCDLKFNMQIYYSNKTRSRNLLEYKQFQMYNNIKWDIDVEYLKEDEDSIYDYFDEDEVNIFKRVFKDYSSYNVIQSLYNCYFELYPKSLNFSLEFLSLDYDNLDVFGKHFEKIVKQDNKGNVDLTNFDELALKNAVDLAHNFESRYLINQ